MYTSDHQILKLIEILKSRGYIQYDKDFCEDIGMSKQQLYNIRTQHSQKHHFSAHHIENICRRYRVDANYIFDLAAVPWPRQAVTQEVTSTPTKQ